MKMTVIRTVVLFVFGRATYVVKYCICKENMSVLPSVCHTRESRLNRSRYRDTLCIMSQGGYVSKFIDGKFCNFECVKERHPLPVHNQNLISAGNVRYLTDGVTFFRLKTDDLF